MPEITQNAVAVHKPSKKKKKKNKESHNAVERHRKEKINAGITRIGDLLPCSPALKQSINMILNQAHRYITELKQQNDEMLLNRGDRVQVEEIKRLRRQVEDLRKESTHYLDLLKANGINFLDDPTIHWKGKQRSAKVAKVTPTHLLSKGIIVYSNGNAAPASGKQPSDATAPSQQDEQLEPTCDAGSAVHNGGQVQDVISSATPRLVPATPLVPAGLGLTVVEQNSTVAPIAPKPPPPVNYITIQSLCPQPAVTAHLPQHPLPVVPAPTLASGSNTALLFPRTPATGVSCFPQGVESRPLVVADVAVTVAQRTTPPGQTLPGGSSLLTAAGNTQTTWTTLQLAGNTVQPVCQSLPTSDASGCEGSSAGPMQVSICSVGIKSTVQPSPIQVQTQTSAVSATSLPPPLPLSSQPHLQQTLLSPPQSAILPQATVLSHPVSGEDPSIVLTSPAVRPLTQQVTVLSQPALQPVAPPQPALIPIVQPKPVLLPQTKSHPTLLPQPQLAVIPQSAVLPQHLSVATPQAQPAVVLPQPPVMPQPQPSVFAHPPSAIVPQALPPPALSAQGQPSVLPVLQTMQVLQLNPGGTTVTAVPAPQSNGNPNVVILQQPSSCQAQQVVREDQCNQTNQTPCQHIVIIQTPQAPPTQNPSHPGILPATVPVVPSHVATSSAVPIHGNQAVSDKQYVQILPQGSSQPPQTITMNGQMFVLQPVKSPEKVCNVMAPVPAQIIQTTTGEEQSGNTTVNNLAPLANTQASSQNNVQLQAIVPPSYTVMQPNTQSTNPTINSSLPVASTHQEIPVTRKKVASVSKSPFKKIGPHKKPGRKPKPPKSKDIQQARCLLPIAAKPVTQQSNPVQSIMPLKPSIAPKTTTTTTTTSTPVSSVNSAASTVVVTNNSSVPKNLPATEITVTSNETVSNAATSDPLAHVSVPVSGTVLTVTDVQSAGNKPSSALPVIASSSDNTVVRPQTVTSSAPSRTVPVTSVTITQKAIAVSKESVTQCGPDSAKSTDNMLLKNSTTVSCAASFVKPTCSAISAQVISRESPQSNNTISIGHCAPSITSYSAVQASSVVTGVNSSLSVPSSSIKTATNPTAHISSQVGHLNPRQLSLPSSQCHGKPSNLLDSTQACHSSTLSLALKPCVESSLQLAPPTSNSQIQASESRKQDHVNVSHGHPHQIVLPPLPSMQVPRTELKLADSQKEELVSVQKELLVSNSCPRKDSTLPQEVYALNHETLEQPHMASTQTESPFSVGGRGFSVASMLPTGHNISASCNSFGTFSFTSEQAEILAMVTSWDLPKSQPASSNKERSTEQQFKPSKSLDLPLVKTSAQTSIRRPPVEGTSRSNRPSHSAPYSQAQSAPVGSLNVNNLIRPSSSQPYPGSPSLTQQTSVPSPGVPGNLASQSSTPNLPNCSVSAQLTDYAPLKSALMRPHVGGVQERHLKDLSKRPAQDDVMLPTNKRPKACQPGSVGRHDVIKGTSDHSQMIISQMTPSSSAVMTRINPENSIFSSSSFMSTVLRPTDGHCPAQGLPQEVSQPVSGVHAQPSHPQHGTAQSQQHSLGAGKNLYLKQHQQDQQQQQQQQQRHHLYQLQHHLTQSDNSQNQLHGIHPRAMQQEQHIHKKRGMVRSGQTGPPVGMQQKAHHLEKSSLQQHAPPQQQHQQHQQQQHQQQQSHQQQQAHQQQQHQQQHHHQSQQQQTQQLQQTQHQQPPHQQQQQQIQQQSSHSRHQHMQQQIQQQQQHFGGRLQEKSCEVQSVGPRSHQSSHLGQQECPSGQPDHSSVQRLMGSRSLDQQLTSQASGVVSRSSDLTCTPSRHERQRLSSYSAEALIGKSSSSGEQRMGLHLQASRGNNQDQPDLRYLERSKGNLTHNPPSRHGPDHPGPADVQRIECPVFKNLSGNHQLANFEVQVSCAGDANKSVPSVQRGPQLQTPFRMGPVSGGDGRSRVPYSGAHPGSQGMAIGAGLPREQEPCHQSFMQNLLTPHLPEQPGHQRPAAQCCPPVSIEYSCVPGTSTGDLQTKASSPSLTSSQKNPAMRLGESNKGHLPQVSGNIHSQGVRSGLPHTATQQSSAEAGRNPATSRPLSAVGQRSRHIGQEAQTSKIRPGERPRSGTVRPSDPFESSDSSLPLPSTGGVILGRTQAQNTESRRGSIVRFMPESSQVSSGTENNLVSDQHLSQNFSFPFIADGSMNPPPPINANSTFIPPVTQSSTSRTAGLLTVDSQNTLPSFYHSYSPAAHPSLPNEIPLQYFPNQMFTSPSTDKSSTAPLNNRFSSILSPPRPVGFAQASFPLLPEMPPMPIGNSSSITPHLSNFNLTSLFPEIATAMPTDGSSMPMSPLLSLANTSSADSSKQTNRPAHNISHILGHDGSSAV